MRILSLLPAATEICFALGLGDSVVGVTDDCDYPEEVKKLPKVTTCQAPNFLSSREINDKVTKFHRVGYGISHLDWNIVETLKPDLFLTQDLCEVCAVGYNEVKKGVRILSGKDVPQIISLEPESIEDIFENIKTIGEVTGKSFVAHSLIRKLKKRLDRISTKTKNDQRQTTKRVLIIEWLDPLMVAGHWTPEMVMASGGENLFTRPGDKSYSIMVDQISSKDPGYIVLSPCGFSIERTLQEKHLIIDLINKLKNTPAVKNNHLFLLDGNQYITRPGPRIIDGVEILAEILNPKMFSRKHSRADWIPFL